MTATQYIKSRSTPNVGGKFIAQHSGLKGGGALMEAPRLYEPKPVAAPCVVMVGGASAKRVRHQRMLAEHSERREAKRVQQIKQARARQRNESVTILAAREAEENGAGQSRVETV